MAVKTKNGWQCNYCGKEYPNVVKADQCRDDHDLIYVPFSRSDLTRLVQFILTKEERLLSSTLYLTLKQVANRERLRLGDLKATLNTPPPGLIERTGNDPEWDNNR